MSTARTGIATPHKSSDFYRPPRMSSDCPEKQLLRRSSLQHWRASRLSQGSQGRENIAEESTPKSAVATSSSALAKDCVTPTQQIQPAGHNRQSSGIKSSSTSSGQGSEPNRKITHGHARQGARDHVIANGTTAEASSTVQAVPATNGTLRSSSLMRPSASSYAYRRKSRSTANFPTHADAPSQSSAGSSSRASHGAPQEASASALGSTGSSSSSRAIGVEDASGDSDGRGLQGRPESSRATTMTTTQVAVPTTEIPESRLKEPETQARRFPAPPKTRVGSSSSSSLGEKGARAPPPGGQLQPPGAACSTMQKSSAPSVQRPTPSSKSLHAGTGSGLKRPATKGTNADHKPSTTSIPATALSRRRGKGEAEDGLPTLHSTASVPSGDAPPLRSGTDRCNTTLRESCATANGVSPARFSSLSRLPSPARALEPADADASGSSAGESASGLLRTRNSATVSSFRKSYGGASHAGGRLSSGIATTRDDALESSSAGEGSRTGDTTAEGNSRTAEDTSGSIRTKTSSVASPFVRKNLDPGASGSSNFCTPPHVNTGATCLTPDSARKVPDPAATLAAASTAERSEGFPPSRITRKSSPSVDDFRKRRGLGFSGLREPASSSKEPSEGVEQGSTQPHRTETSRSRVGSPLPVTAVIEGPSLRKQSALITAAAPSCLRALQDRVETDDARVQDKPRKGVNQEQCADGVKIVGVGVRSSTEANVSKHRDGVGVAHDPSTGEATGSREGDRLEESADDRPSSSPVGGRRWDKDRVCNGCISSEPSDARQEDGSEAFDGGSGYISPEQVNRIEENGKAVLGSHLTPDCNGEQGGGNAAANGRPGLGSTNASETNNKVPREGRFFSGAASLRQEQQPEGEGDAENCCHTAVNGYSSVEPAGVHQEGGNVASVTALPPEQGVEQQEHEMVASLDRACPGLAGERHDEGKEASAVRGGSSPEPTRGQEAGSVVEGSGPSSGVPRGEGLRGLTPSTESCLAEPVDKRPDTSGVDLGAPSPVETESGQGDTPKASSKERKPVLQGNKAAKSLPNRFFQLRERRQLRAQSATDGIKRIGSLGLSLLAGSSGAKPKEDAAADASGDEGTSEGSGFSDDESETSDSGTSSDNDSNSNSSSDSGGNESSEGGDEDDGTSNWVSRTRSWRVGRSSAARDHVDIDSGSSSSEGSEVSGESRRSFEGGSSKLSSRRERRGHLRGHSTFSASPNRRRRAKTCSHACIQAGGGGLLAGEELAQESALREFRERLEMSRQDLLMERFYREVVMQEQAELRKNVTTKLEAEVAALKKQIRDQELLHEKEKISLRWQQDDQIQELEKSLRSEGNQSEAALEEAREKAEDARLEAEALKRSNLEHKAELDDLRRKYREQGVALREERQALAKCEAQTRIVAKHCQAARDALKAFVDEEDDEDQDDAGDEEEDEDEDEDGHEDDGGMFRGKRQGKIGEGQGYREDTRNRE